MGIFQFLKWQPSASWFSYVHVWTTRGEYLVLFITVQNLDGIDAVVSIICKCWYLMSLAWKCLFTPQMVVFWGYRSHIATTQKGPPCAATRHTTYRPRRSVHLFLHSSLFYPWNPMLFNGLDTPLKVAFPVGHLHPDLTHGSLGQRDSAPQTAFLSVQPFLHSSRQSVPILHNWPPLPPKNCPFPRRDLDPHVTHGSLGPPKFTTNTASQSVQPFSYSSQ